MKRGLLILAGSILLAVAGFVISRSLPMSQTGAEHGMHESGTQLPELAWLRHEFQLSASDFEKVSALHLDYLPTCESFCRKIAAARARVRQLVLDGRSVSPELEAALREEAALRAECQIAMLRHIYVTAGALPPEKADAYLEAMLPEVLAMTSDTKEEHRGH